MQQLYCYCIKKLKYKPQCFLKKKVDFYKHRLTPSYIPSNSLSLLYLRICFINQNKSFILMIRKGWSFCDQSFQSLAILQKMLKTFIFIFFQL